MRTWMSGNRRARLQISGNFIGTNFNGGRATYTSSNGQTFSFGNSSDGVFLDGIAAATIGGASSAGVGVPPGNVISNNSANGIDLLNCVNIQIFENEVGTNAQGNGFILDASGNKIPILDSQLKPIPGQFQTERFGNGASGIFVNQAGGNGTTPGVNAITGNVISGNLQSGITISGPSNGTVSTQVNLIQGNTIGLDSGRTFAIPNAVSGLILSNASGNMVGAVSGGLSSGLANVIAGNGLYGVLMVNNALGNQITNNYIGTNQSGATILGNAADGIFLLGGVDSGVTIKGVTVASGSISGNTISGNVTAGNNDNGVQLFGAGATGNVAHKQQDRHRRRRVDLRAQRRRRGLSE